MEKPKSKNPIATITRERAVIIFNQSQGELLFFFEGGPELYTVTVSRPAKFAVESVLEAQNRIVLQ